MQDLYKVLMVEKGDSLQLDNMNYFYDLKSFLRIYFDTIGRTCIYHISTKCCALQMLELGLTFDLIAFEEYQLELLDAAMSLDNDPLIVLIEPRVFGNLEDPWANLSYWERKILYLAEWSNIKEFVKVFDPKLGGIYRSKMESYFTGLEMPEFS